MITRLSIDITKGPRPGLVLVLSADKELSCRSITNKRMSSSKFNNLMIFCYNNFSAPFQPTLAPGHLVLMQSSMLLEIWESGRSAEVSSVR